MPTLVAWTLLLFAAFPTLAEAQEPAEGAEEAQHEVSEHEGAEHEHHKNLAGFLVANTYEAEAGVHLFTIGGEYGRHITERVSVVGEFEYAPDPDAWIFVAPVELEVYRGLEIFAGPGIEHLSRRSGHGDEEREQAEREEEETEEGAGNLFLFRIGGGYHIPLGERFFMFPHVAIDFVNEEEGVAKAVVYGVTIGVGF